MDYKYTIKHKLYKSSKISKSGTAPGKLSHNSIKTPETVNTILFKSRKTQNSIM